MIRLPSALLVLMPLACAPAIPAAQGPVGQGSPARAAEPATRAAYLDPAGVVRWRDDDTEVTLFGANYALPSSGDYRAAGYLTDDRKRLIDEDLAHFARMGWNGLRVAFWGDWQNADLAGNLIENDHLDLMDYLIARARERGIYILFNPIHTYNAGWPDAMEDSFPGFAAHIPKDRLGTDSAAIAAQTRYLRQILAHVNPYTGVALADEPSILFVEMINEPTHHPEDLDGSVRYIDALVDAVRDAGSRAITFHNVSQDFRIADAIVRSRVQGASFGWYPTGLNSGRTLEGNHLRAVEAYPPMRMPALEGVPKVVYEFDSADQHTGVMYPAMARAYREGGAQLAAMFAYDMLETASRNLGWQTHYLNLVYTPRKAMSAVIAAEAMRRLPRLETWGAYPHNNRFGDFHLFPDDDVAVLAASDAYINAGSTALAAPDPAALRRVAGYGSSPVVDYPGEGVYFLDRVREGVWRLEVYPDAVPVDDPFEMPNVDKVVTRSIWRAWPMTIRLPDLREEFFVQRIAGGEDGSPAADPATDPDGARNRAAAAGDRRGAASPQPEVASRAEAGRFVVSPGVYVLSADGPVDPASLPTHVGPVRFDEFVAPAPDSVGLRVVVDGPPQHVAGQALELDARVVAAAPPDSVTLWIGPAARGWLRPVPMRHAGPYAWRATVPQDALPPGPAAYVVAVYDDGATTTFPAGASRDPGDWDYNRSDPAWTLEVVRPETPLRLLAPGEDAGRLAFSRIGDGWRQGIFQVLPSDATGEPVLHLELPVNVDGITPDDYTTSLMVKDRIDGRGAAIQGARALSVRLRGVGPRQTVHLTLVESDGTSWSAPLAVDGTGWVERTVVLADLQVARGVKLPQGFPSDWNYWIEPAAGRGGPDDGIRIGEVERLQLSLRAADAAALEPGSYGVEVESVTLLFR